MTIYLILKINRYHYNSFSSVLIGLLLLDEIEEASSTFNNFGSMTNRLSFLFIWFRIEEFSTKLTYLLYILLRYTKPSMPLFSLGKDKVLNISKANDLNGIFRNLHIEFDACKNCCYHWYGTSYDGYCFLTYKSITSNTERTAENA